MGIRTYAEKVGGGTAVSELPSVAGTHSPTSDTRHALELGQLQCMRATTMHDRTYKAESPLPSLSRSIGARDRFGNGLDPNVTCGAKLGCGKKVGGGALDPLDVDDPPTAEPLPLRLKVTV